MKWIKGTKEGIVVVDGEGRETALTHLSWPEGIFVDQSESIYAADCSNNRINSLDFSLKVFFSKKRT
jgi:hypothetical protein